METNSSGAETGYRPSALIGLLVLGIVAVSVVLVTQSSGQPNRPQPVINSVGSSAPAPILPSTTPLAVTDIAISTDSATSTAPDVTAAVNPGDPDSGHYIFVNVTKCIGCHDTTGKIFKVGPSLKAVAVRAATRKPGMSAEAYLRESILTPNAYIVQGYPANLMPQNFGQVLSAQDLNDVIAYLMTLN